MYIKKYGNYIKNVIDNILHVLWVQLHNFSNRKYFLCCNYNVVHFSNINASSVCVKSVAARRVKKWEDKF